MLVTWNHLSILRFRKHAYSPPLPRLPGLFVPQALGCCLGNTGQWLPRGRPGSHHGDLRMFLFTPPSQLSDLCRSQPSEHSRLAWESGRFLCSEEAVFCKLCLLCQELQEHGLLSAVMGARSDTVGVIYWNTWHLGNAVFTSPERDNGGQERSNLHKTA